MARPRTDITNEILTVLTDQWQTTGRIQNQTGIQYWKLKEKLVDMANEKKIESQLKGKRSMLWRLPEKTQGELHPVVKTGDASN